MKRFFVAFAGFSALAFSAQAQQTYRCENGELLGSDVQAKCTMNSAGQITSVTPYTGNREQVKIYRNSGNVQTVSPPPVRSYSSGRRAYAPAPLTPQSRPSGQAVTRSYSGNELRQQYPAPRYATTSHRPTPTTVYRPAVQPRVMTAAPTPRIQTAEYRQPCNFRIREIPTRGDIEMFEVCYSDLTPVRGRSIDKLYARIKRASRKACGTQYSSVLTRWSRRNNDCVSESLNRAVMSSGIDPLRAYHLARTGRGVPTVYVGEPRSY